MDPILHVYRTVEDQELRLELFEPADPGLARPALVLFHGGGWRMGSPRQFRRQCERLAATGVVAISAAYRLARPDSGRTPLCCVEDATAALAWVHAQSERLRVDPTRIAAGGGSAGGQLAAAVASLGLPVAALVLFNPALAPDGTPSLAFLEDPEAHFSLGEGFPPALVLHGTADRLVPIAHSRRFRDRLKTLGVRCELVEYEGMEHAFFNAHEPEGRYASTLACVERFLASLNLLGRGAECVAEGRNVKHEEKPGD